MKTSGGFGNLPEGESEDVVKTEAEAIAIAEAFLKWREEYRIEHLRQLEERTGRFHRVDDWIQHPLIYVRKKIETYPNGWMLEYERTCSSGAASDPPYVDVGVNKKTGEARFGWFCDD